jgi:glycosyltransferase involved in cell wall biosynthesis
VLGGAERSLRLIAETLASREHAVEVFTTGRRSETINGVRVHRFRADAVDDSAFAAATERLRRGGVIPADVADDFLRQTRHSAALLDAYSKRSDEFDACIVGPYGNGLTWEALRIVPERTLLVPCFHREPLAKQPMFAAAFGACGGLLYHSNAERRLAELELGIHHPNSAVIGTWLAPGCGDPLRGWRLAGGDKPYLLYAGRACREKNVPLLLDWLRLYAADRGELFRLVMIGGGPIKSRDGLDCVDFAFVNETDRADLTAGAAALVQLSTNESLSLAALESWNEGAPVIAHAGCDVLNELIAATRGGEAVGGYEPFRAVLDDLHANPEAWAARGRRGRDFVRAAYGSRDEFAGRIERVLTGLNRPLAEIMRERGREVTAEKTAANWQRAFAERIDAVLHAEPIDPRAAPVPSPDQRLNTRLADAAGLVELPVGYDDVSEGPLARVKHTVKRKLLHQFQASYIDVLSRQQTELNHVLLDVVRELAARVDALERRLEDRQGEQSSPCLLSPLSRLAMSPALPVETEAENQG